MSPRKKSTSDPCNKQVVVVCVQEPFEEGSAMDFGLIKGDDIRFLHQAFITDTIMHALELGDTDVRLYYQNQPDRVRLVKIVMDYLKKKLSGELAERFEKQLSTFPQKKDRWGIRIERAFKECFDSGYDAVLLVGSRTPTVTSKMMRSAWNMLSQSDVIFGPTPEGRYYSIGMSGAYQIELSAFDWTSPSIYADIAGAFTDKGLHWSELPIWYAVESSEELEIMARDINQFRFEGDETTARETELVMERILAKLS
ncbi:MAG: DUF2064 domain-containing protein [candidate division Zixibacteria bacterium]|jgi:glycosyltransferase A (GT-A) superfamily protein (DUF2064 family)|nr:DUF2064 domain-containing protein [candidate division Zixibacteria bacterium]